MAVPFEFLRFRQTIGRLYAHCCEPVLTQHGLTQNELDILLFLANNPQHDTAREIVSLRCLAKSQVSQSLDRLTQRGWLARTPDAANARLQHLQLLPTAELAVSQGRQVQQAFWAALTAGIPPAETQQALATLERMLENAWRSNAAGKEEN